MTVTPSGVVIGSPMMVLESTISRILSIVVSMRSLSGVFFSMFSMRFILSFYAVSFSLCSLFCGVLSVGFSAGASFLCAFL